MIVGLIRYLNRGLERLMGLRGMNISNSHDLQVVVGMILKFEI
jgi:hypothetical protein